MSPEDKDEAMNMLVIASQSDQDLFDMIRTEGTFVQKYLTLYKAIEGRFAHTGKLTEQQREWFVKHLASNGKSKS